MTVFNVKTFAAVRQFTLLLFGARGKKNNAHGLVVWLNDKRPGPVIEKAHESG